MHVTIFSFVTAVLMSSLLILLLYLSRKSVGTIRMMSVGYLFCLYLFCLGRMFFSVELPFTRVISAPLLMNPLLTFQKSKIPVMGQDISVSGLLCLIWAAGILFLLARFFLRCRRENKAIDALPKQENQLIQALLNELQQEQKRQFPIQVLCCPNLSTPCGVGLLQRKILLPSQEYTEEELLHILRHELQHFQTHDLLVKWMIRVFQCLFWWNPLVYLLGRDLDQVLELKCDLAVIKDYEKQDVIAYLQTIKNHLERASEIQEMAPVGATSLIGNFAMPNVEERFLCIAASQKPNHRKELPKPIFVLLLTVLIIGSYSIVLQSKFDWPEFDENGEKIQYMLDEETLLVRMKDGTYQEIYQNEAVTIPTFLAEEKIRQGVTVVDEGTELPPLKQSME